MNEVPKERFQQESAIKKSVNKSHWQQLRMVSSHLKKEEDIVFKEVAEWDTKSNTDNQQNRYQSAVCVQ